MSVLSPPQEFDNGWIMEVVPFQFSSCPIQRLPDELIARLLVVGCWLPGRIDETKRQDRVGHPPRLKPFAKLMGSICTRWRTIINWRAIHGEVYHAKVSLCALIPTYSSFPEVLLGYLRDLRNYEGVDLDIFWECRDRINFADEESTDSLTASVIRLFIHGMNLTAPSLGRARSLHADLWQPEAINFCLRMVNNIHNNSRLAHVSMCGELFPEQDSNLANLARLAVATFSPIFASPGAKWTGCHFKPSFYALSHLEIRHISILDSLTIPTDLSHLTLECLPLPVQWRELQTLIIQGRRLVSLILITGIEGIPDVTSIGLHDMAHLTELTLGSANIFSAFKLLLSLSMPGLKRLILENIFRRDNVGEITDSARLTGMHKSLNPTSQFLAPAELRFKFTDEGAVELLLDHMILDVVNSLHLSYHGHGFSVEGRKAGMAGYHLPALPALHLYSYYAVSWTPLLQHFIIPAAQTLSYEVYDLDAYHIQHMKYTNGWLSFNAEMGGLLSQISHLKLSLPFLGPADNVKSHLFSRLWSVEHLTLSNVMERGLEAINWLCWPSPEDSASGESSPNNLLLATMPRLKSLLIVMDRFELGTGREQLVPRSLMEKLREVLFSREINKHPVENVWVGTEDERTWWRNQNPGRALEEVLIFLEKNSPL